MRVSIRGIIVSVLAICLIGFGFFSYRNKTRSHANPSSGTKLSRVKGKMKWFNEAKGYGFITQEDGTDVFVDRSAVQPDGFKGLQEGDEVEFEVVRGPKGQMAENVVKVARPSH